MAWGDLGSRCCNGDKRANGIAAPACGREVGLTVVALKSVDPLRPGPGTAARELALAHPDVRRLGLRACRAPTSGSRVRCATGSAFAGSPRRHVPVLRCA